MFKSMRRMNREYGFTLIELMVVVMIIAILIAIAIPSFLGFRKNAQERSVQSDLRTVLLAQNAYFLENNAFTGDQADIIAIEANARFDGVSIEESTPNLCLLGTSESTNTFAVYQVANGATLYSLGTTATCPETAPTAGASWSQTGWGAAGAEVVE